MSFTSRTIVFTRHNEDNSAAGGTISFQLTEPISDGTTTIDPVPLFVTLVAGAGSVALNADDDGTTTPAGSAYIVREFIAGIGSDPYRVIVPSAGSGSLDLDDLVRA